MSLFEKLKRKISLLVVAGAANRNGNEADAVPDAAASHAGPAGRPRYQRHVQRTCQPRRGSSSSVAEISVVLCMVTVFTAIIDVRIDLCD